MSTKQCGHHGRCKKCLCVPCRKSGRPCISFSQYARHAQENLWEIEEIEEAVNISNDLFDEPLDIVGDSASEESYVSTTTEEQMLEPDSEDEDLAAQYRRQLMLEDLDEDLCLFVEEQLRSVQKEQACQKLVGLVSANVMTKQALTQVTAIWNEYSKVY